ncbi:penicillin-binding protein 1A [Alicyclobacillus hesperidum]|uniref:Penicillin-binding protein 1A n=1 Tax=Alicyclobacillus hesperidum TaxID=89784 RepID=A0A1H2Q3P6_9BACL|nr:transglycosylase domain-containing protein [Alicyclobacillus hesperidum]GLV12824.1 penicillin-binding protein 1A [Alicyclobacillus hesperidum]SDW01772.1 penicillin-binding protein 1A [Alicyclobacillus hesperidum]
MKKRRNRVGQETIVVRDPRATARKREQKASRFWVAMRVSLFSLGSLGVLGCAAGAGYVASLLKGLPKVNAATFVNNSAASVVYDCHGKVIGRFTGDGDRQPITSISQVSPYLVNAFVAAEDKTFFTNIGINPLSMARALVQDLAGHSIESGASTITQQTVKLAVFPEQQRTMRRKIQEIALAIQVNHVLTKDEILTDYMNWVYMGRMGTDTVYGVRRASEILFGKNPKDLNLPEAAFLAALPNNPSYFSPYEFPQHTLQRQHYILDQMLADKLISRAAYDQAYHYDVLKHIHPAPESGLPAHPYLMLDEIKPRVIQALVQAGVYENAVQAESALPVAGLKIYTTIDLTKQNQVEQVLSNDALFAGTDKTYRLASGKTATDLYEAGFTLIDNQTGGILAVGGGRDYLKDAIDHADIARQPGSSIKPLLDYGPAIDRGLITAGTVLYDAPTLFPGSGGEPAYEPHDDEPDFAGLLSARQALYESRNVPAIDILAELTPQVGFSYLSKMGLGTNAKTLDGEPTIVADDENHLAAAIGGLDNGATVEQMTSAYTTLANQGVWHESYMISQIEDNTGRILYQADPQTHQVFSPATAYIVTDMLHDVLYHSGGTATMIGAHFPGQYISGKTGTTDALGDGWFIGYTQQYTAGIWMGYNNHELISPGAEYNLKFTLWNDIMTPILAAAPAKKPWPKPTNVVSKAVSSTSGLLPTPLSTAHGEITTEPFVQGTEPTQYDDVDVEVKYVVIHGKKYLATSHTPLSEVRTGVFMKLPESRILDWEHKIPGGVTDDTPYLAPTEPDPRGGIVLDAGSVPAITSPSQMAAPTGLTGTFDGTDVTLSWKPVTGANQYDVYRASNPNGPYTQIGTNDVPWYVDTAVPSSGQTTLYYKVFAESSIALSQASQTIAVQVEKSGGSNDGANNTANGITGAPADTLNSTTPEANKSNGEGDNSDNSGSVNGTTRQPKATQHWLPGLGGQ